MARITAALLLVALLPLNDARSFMGARPEVDPAYVQLLVQGALRSVLGSGHNVGQSRLTDINATLVPLFSILPKNNHGRLSVPFMRYVVQRYFSQRHGWVIKGFEPYAENRTQDTMDGSHILQSKIPGYVESILEKSLSHGGFSLQDVTIAIAAIEILIFDENLKGLEASYYLNNMSSTAAIESRDALMEILISYFIVEHLDGDSSDIEQHTFDKENIHAFYPHWPDMRDFISDMAFEDGFHQDHFENPFVAQRTFSYEDVARTTRRLAEHYGPFSNHECHVMKLKLSEMDVHGTGRVRLSDFYRASQEGDEQFLETTEYLNAIGALDTSSQYLGPQVIIPNYIVGPNNCISSSLYYDVCCLNECDGIYQHLEAKLGQASASVAEIKSAIEGGITLAPVLSSSAPTEARNLSAPLIEQLEQISAHHGGKIPLHGRLFAQWLHYAYPRECPFPHKSGTVNVQEVMDLRTAGRDIVNSGEEIAVHIDSHFSKRALSPQAGLSMWSMDEELLGPTSASGTSWKSLPRFAVHAVMLAAFAGMVLKEWKRLRRACGKADVPRDASYYI